MDDKREMLRHFLATIAYRTQKAVRGAPADYGDYEAGAGARTPRDILHHMRGLVMFVHSHVRPYESTYPPKLSWEEEVQGFHEVLARLDADLGAGLPLVDKTHERLLQGPLADVMTHIGYPNPASRVGHRQLAMLRRLAGAAVPAENFINADIRTGRVGAEQPDPADPD
jgi:hypothetical protein